MNLQESDLFRDEIEKNTRKRRGVMLSIILCAFLIVLLVVMIGIIKKQDALTEKFFLNDKQISLPRNFYRIEDNTTYINVTEMAKLLGYDYKRGNYGLYDEDEESCSLTNSFEIIALSAHSEKFIKYIEIVPGTMLADIPVIQSTKTGYSEGFKLEKPVKYIEGTLYVPLENVPDMFNLQIDWKEYRKRIYSLEYVVGKIKGSAGSYGITEINGNYENLRALLYGYIVSGNGVDGAIGNKYGVYSLNEGKEILTVQYKDVRFIQNSKEFFITTEKEKMGLVDGYGDNIIKAAEYDEISLLDEDTQLYIVRKNNEYGVLNRNGKVILPPEYDEIGYNTGEFSYDVIENSNLFFNKCIPVKKNGEYGLINTKGEIVLSIVYDNLGYRSQSSSRTAGSEESILTIPTSVGINGIIINKDGLFGIFDVNAGDNKEGAIVLPCTFSKIYAVRKSGELIYYAEEQDSTTYKLTDFLQDNDLANMLEKDNKKSKKDENKKEVVTNKDDEEDDEEDEENTNTTKETQVVEIDE